MGSAKGAFAKVQRQQGSEVPWSTVPWVLSMLRLRGSHYFVSHLLSQPCPAPQQQ